jgi:hypothetical protein
MRKFAMVLAATVCFTSAANAQLMSIPGPFVGPGTPWGFGGGLFGAGPGIGWGGAGNALTGLGMLGGVMGGMGGNNYGAPVVGGGAIGYGVPAPVYMQQPVYSAPPPPSSVAMVAPTVIQVNPVVRYYKRPKPRVQTRTIIRERIVSPRAVEEIDIVQNIPPAAMRPPIVLPTPGPVAAYRSVCPSGAAPQPQAIYDAWGRWVGQRMICY